ncbi:hypothetical protein PCHCB_000501000 [Plasmodium chabaudi chabaudi]|uniref:Fam-c protein n=1 Tax=Plasmodium chabaudi chabaudi TaxID=31271 RepID=A0A1D3L798_PLACU|nr:hypothetical protein PCHCB_000501000 [Plasmodium chabaudi chabaudi]
MNKRIFILVCIVLYALLAVSIHCSEQKSKHETQLNNNNNNDYYYNRDDYDYDRDDYDYGRDDYDHDRDDYDTCYDDKEGRIGVVKDKSRCCGCWG